MKSKRAFVRHHKCNGTGYGSRYGVKCRGCKGTGRADAAFEIALQRPLLYAFELDADFDRMLDHYITVRYGSTVEVQNPDEEDRYKASLYMVLQHTIDRDAARTVIRLGGIERLFAYLVEQEKVLMRGVRPKDFEWC